MEHCDFLAPHSAFNLWSTHVHGGLEAELGCPSSPPEGHHTVDGSSLLLSHSGSCGPHAPAGLPLPLRPAQVCPPPELPPGSRPGSGLGVEAGPSQCYWLVPDGTLLLLPSPSYLPPALGRGSSRTGSCLPHPPPSTLLVGWGPLLQPHLWRCAGTVVVASLEP